MLVSEVVYVQERTKRKNWREMGEDEYVSEQKGERIESPKRPAKRVREQVGGVEEKEKSWGM